MDRMCKSRRTVDHTTRDRCSYRAGQTDRRDVRVRTDSVRSSKNRDFLGGISQFKYVFGKSVDVQFFSSIYAKSLYNQ